MVARKAPRRRRKWRFHCSTCGTPFEGRQLWAYCSKECEVDRRGLHEQPPMRSFAVDGYLDLAQKLEDAMPWERSELLARMAELQREREAPVNTENFHGDPKDVGTAEDWINGIRPTADLLEAAHRRSVRLAIKLGDLLLEAKAAMKHGEFGRLFRDHDRPAFGALPFSANWGRRLMALAGTPLIAKREHASVLPTDVDACYLLTRLGDEALGTAIADGQVHAAMTRDDVRRLLPQKADEEPTEDELLARVLHRVRRRLLGFVGEHPKLLDRLCEQLTEIVREAEAAAQGGTN